MSFDIVHYNIKNNKFSWGSNCLPGEPNECINHVPQGGDLYLLDVTVIYEDGDTEFLAFNPSKGNISLWVYFSDLGMFDELEVLGKWDTPVISKEDYKKMREHVFKMYEHYELCEFEKYLEENKEN